MLVLADLSKEVRLQHKRSHITLDICHTATSDTGGATSATEYSTLSAGLSLTEEGATGSVDGCTVSEVRHTLPNKVSLANCDEGQHRRMNNSSDQKTMRHR